MSMNDQFTSRVLAVIENNPDTVCTHLGIGEDDDSDDSTADEVERLTSEVNSLTARLRDADVRLAQLEAAVAVIVQGYTFEQVTDNEYRARKPRHTHIATPAAVEAIAG
jgi:hypothetical protein